MKIPILTNLLERRSLGKFDEFLDFLIGEQSNSSGASVTEKTALSSPTVFACVRILSETIASLPLPVYRRLQPRGKERASEHPLYNILHDAPNPYMTAMTFMETMQGHLATWGNAYADIHWTGSGKVQALWPLRPDRMEKIKFNDQGKLVYIYRLPNGEATELQAYRVLHVAGLGFDGYMGYSPIRLEKEAIGLALATEKYGSKFFESGAKPGGVLEHPGKLQDEARGNLRDSWNEMHRGINNAHRIAILEQGLTYKQIGLPPEDAQFLQTRKFQIEEIARIYRIPLHLLQSLDRATNNNIEHQGIDFVVHTIRPWLVRWEQAIKQKLLLGKDRENYFAEFLVDGLLRGDTETRFKAYSVGRQWGWLSANDVRELENMNPLPDEQGEKYLTPMNMISAERIDEQMPKSKAPPEANSAAAPLEKRSTNQGALLRARIAAGYEPIIKDSVARVLKGEIADIKRAVKGKLTGEKDPTDFLRWLEEYYENKAPDRIRKTMQPVFYSLADMIQREAVNEINEKGGMTPELEIFISEYTDVFVKRYIGSSRGQIEALIRDNRSARDDVIVEVDPAGAVLERLDGWEENREEKVSESEAVRLANAIARAVFIAYGVTRLRWAAIGSDTCPFCEEMDGKVVSVEQSFMSDGSELTAGGKTLKIFSKTKHPPLHAGCVCSIIPERG